MAASFPLVDFEPQSNALRFMRRVRWLGAIFALVQFALYEPPPGVTVPFDQWRMGLGIAGGIVVLNLVLLHFERTLREHFQRLVLIGLLCDAMAVFGLVWLFRFDTTSALWGLLVIPVLEAAIAAQLVGALGMWALLAIGYVIRELDTAARYDYAIFEVPSLTFRMGIVLIVAATAGSLARSLTQEARAQRAARLESQQRARLLHGLALSSQALLEAQTQTSAHQVWDAIVAAATDVGFRAASITVLDADRASYRVACGRGLPDGYVGTVHPAGTGIAGAVWDRGETVTLTDYSGSVHAAPGLKSLHYGATIAVPIRRGLEIEAVLVAAVAEPGELPVAERECIELLAVHAGVALANVAHSAERARFEQQLTEIAYTDSLTGLPNREVFLERLTAAVAGPTTARAAVLFIDLDRFKTVNDSLGHHGGDALLIELSKRLLEVAQPHLVARFGGDEFTVLVEGVGHPDVARAIATHLMEALSTPLHVDDHEIVPSVSVGIRCAEPGDTADVLLRDADTAMYRAKALGRHRVELFDPHQAPALPSLTVEAEMRRGLQAGEFEVHYQPVVSLLNGHTTSVEALLRWNHPTRGPVSPADFIPVAEDSGFIVQLGRWVLNEACAQAAAWRSDGHLLDVAVNVSVVQLQHDGLLDDITTALHQTGLCPSQLVLEITESATVTNPALMLSQARRIRGLGVRLALDDFGEGTTSLRFVRRLPLNVLKIDKCLVDDLLPGHHSGRGDQAAVVRSVIQLAHDLGLTVTAEGVEEEAQLAMLVELGCDQAQGYLLGRPALAADVAALMGAEAALDEVVA